MLSRRQIGDQIAHEAVAAGATPIYILVGTSAIMRGRRWGQWKWVVGERPLPLIFDGAALTEAIQASVGDDTDADVRELAASYLRVLDHLALRHQAYRGKPIDAFGYHDFLGYFHDLRQAVDLGLGATVEYVPNAAGGFVCCAWEGVPTRVGRLYLQFEHDALCLKVWVDDMERDDRPQARRDAVDAAIDTAAAFPRLGVEATRGRAGETMTLVRLPGIKLTPDPRDEGLHASLREAQAFVRATAAKLG